MLSFNNYNIDKIFIYSISRENNRYKIKYFINYVVDLNSFKTLYMLENTLDKELVIDASKVLGKWKKVRFDYVGNIKHIY